MSPTVGLKRFKNVSTVEIDPGSGDLGVFTEKTSARVQEGTARYFLAPVCQCGQTVLRYTTLCGASFLVSGLIGGTYFSWATASAMWTWSPKDSLFFALIVCGWVGRLGLLSGVSALAFKALLPRLGVRPTFLVWSLALWSSALLPQNWCHPSGENLAFDTLSSGTVGLIGGITALVGSEMLPKLIDFGRPKSLSTNARLDRMSDCEAAGTGYQEHNRLLDNELHLDSGSDD